MLFHKKTKKAIKYVWGAFSVVIILSMILTYSGVLYLTAGTAQEQIPTSEDAFAQLTPEERSALEARMNVDASGTPLTFTPVGADGQTMTPETREKIEQQLRQIPPTGDAEQAVPSPVPPSEPVPSLNFNVPQ